MKRTDQRHFCAGCILLLSPLCAAAADKASQLDQSLQRYHDLGQFNGVALVVGGGSTVLRQEYGLANRDWQIENSPETRFLVGSITKSFTALVIAQLQEQGKLDPDATVSDYLPGYRKDTGSRITLRHLLTHTDGIPNYTGNVYFWQSYENDIPYTTAEFVTRYCSGDLAFEPGSQYRYGNAGYSILGAIIENATGMSYADAVESLVLRPLGMHDSGQYSSGAILEKRASGYEIAIDGYRPAAPVNKPFFAAGSMYTTVDDLAIYHRALYGNDVVTAAGRNMLFQSREGVVEGTFAYGWDVGVLTLDGAIPGTRYTATNGEINGFNAVMIRLPDAGHLIVLLNNTGETDLFGIAGNLMRILYDLPVTPPAPRLRDTFVALLRDESFDAAISFYRDQRESNPRDYLFFPWPMRILAGQLIKDGRYSDAIALLHLNLETNPNDSRSFVSLGQAQLQSGDVTDARASFRSALSLDGTDEYAADMLRTLED